MRVNYRQSKGFLTPKHGQHKAFLQEILENKALCGKINLIGVNIMQYKYTMSAVQERLISVNTEKDVISRTFEIESNDDVFALIG